MGEGVPLLQRRCPTEWSSPHPSLAEALPLTRRGWGPASVVGDPPSCRPPPHSARVLQELVAVRFPVRPHDPEQLHPCYCSSLRCSVVLLLVGGRGRFLPQLFLEPGEDPSEPPRPARE